MSKYLDFYTLDDAREHFSKLGYTLTRQDLTNCVMEKRDGKATLQAFINRLAPDRVSAQVHFFKN